MANIAKGPTPFGQAPIVAGGNSGMLTPDANGNPQVSPFGLVQVAAAPTVAPTGTQPTAVYCTLNLKIYVYDSVALAWKSTVALS